MYMNVIIHHVLFIWYGGGGGNLDMSEYCKYCGQEIIYDPVDGGAPRYTDFRHVKTRTRKCRGMNEYAFPEEVRW